MTPLHKKILERANFDEAQDIREQGEVYLRSARFLPIISSLLEANQRLAEVVTSVMQTSSVGSEKYNWCEEYLAANAGLLERIAGDGDGK